MFPGNRTLAFLMVLQLACAPSAHAQTQKPTPPPAKPSVAAPAPKAAVPAPKAEAPAPVVQSDKSLFFTADNVRNIKDALQIFDSRDVQATGDNNKEAAGEDFLSKLVDVDNSAPKQKRIYVYPQFHLESIIYNGPNNWIAWINNQKLTSQGAPNVGDLRVLDIDRGHIMIEWKPANMKRVLQSWDPLSDTFVQVDALKGLVTFTLRPNQTFSSYRMKVMEGRLVPVQVLEDEEDYKNGTIAPKVAVPKEGETPASEGEEPHQSKLPSVPSFTMR